MHLFSFADEPENKNGSFEDENVSFRKIFTNSVEVSTILKHLFFANNYTKCFDLDTMLICLMIFRITDVLPTMVRLIVNLPSVISPNVWSPYYLLLI